jgi:very-short-patch-repair endonuclease
VKDAVRRQLLAINARFYRQFAAPFAATRRRLQPGIERLLPTLLQSGRMLDLGCGSGELIRRLVEYGYAGDYLGLDFSPEMVEIAKLAAPPNPLSIKWRGGEEDSHISLSVSSLTSPPGPTCPPAPAGARSGFGHPKRVPMEWGGGEPLAPPLHPMEKGTGGEVPRGGQGGEVNVHGGEVDPLLALSESLAITHPRTAPPALWEKLKPIAREMRREPTPAENQLWQALRRQQLAGYKFRRQHAIDRFLVDFYCPSTDLVIEVDGPIHQYTPQEDALRQQCLEAIGLRVMHFSNDQVLEHLPEVLAEIRRYLASVKIPERVVTSSPSPLPDGGLTSPPGPLPL